MNERLNVLTVKCILTAQEDSILRRWHKDNPADSSRAYLKCFERCYLQLDRTAGALTSKLNSWPDSCVHSLKWESQEGRRFIVEA
jgi:hypothetical protein